MPIKAKRGLDLRFKVLGLGLEKALEKFIG